MRSSWNERFNNDRNHETQLPKQQTDDINERILNELGVVQEKYVKDRETLIKINITKKLKNKIELRNAALEMILLETEPDVTKYIKVKYAIAKVMTEL